MGGNSAGGGGRNSGEARVGQREVVPGIGRRAPGEYKVGTKFDADKIRYELIAPEFLEGIAAVLTLGAKKYGDRNWEKGMKWSRVFGALMRHMWAMWRGEDKDPETGFLHALHAGCCVMFLAVYQMRGIGEDDRPK